MTAPGTAFAQNLIQNPSFEAGVADYFTQYTLTFPGQVLNPGDYTIIDDPRVWNPGLRSVPDHTAFGTQMLVADGIAGRTVWQQAINLQPQSGYVFKLWWNWLNQPNHPAAPQLSVQRSTDGVNWVPFFTAMAAGQGVWTSEEHAFHTNQSVSWWLRIVDLQNAEDGNDFAIDDLELTPCVDPVVTILPVGIFTRVGATVRISVVADGVMGSPGYQWRRNGVGVFNGPRISGAQSSTLTIAPFLAADQGNYTCEVFDECGSVVSDPSIVRLMPLGIR